MLAAELIPESSRVAERLRISRDLHDLVGQLREARAELRDALQDMAGAVPSPQVHLDLPDDLTRLGTEFATTVLRCVQEIITNAMRHADADHLWISIACVGGEVVLTARDDGHGAWRAAATCSPDLRREASPGTADAS